MKYYTSIIILSWITLAVLCILVHENDRLSGEEKRPFYITYLVIGLAAFAELTGHLLNGNTAYPEWMLRLVKCVDYILTPAASAALVTQLRGQSKRLKILYSLLIINIFFQIIGSLTGMTLVIDGDGYYSHGRLYNLYMLLYFTVIVLTLLEFISYGNRFRRQNRISMYAIIALVVIGILMQELSGGETSYLAITMGAALLYIHLTEFHMITTDDTLREQELQLMVGQIQPHFVFNCLAVIQATYRRDIESGNKAINLFSEFLRHNMDSLRSEKLIPFNEEIKHVNRYLELQQLRFGEELQTEFDLKYTDFSIPTLTLQPLVENAITHGVRKQPEHDGIVTISSRMCEDHYEVSVSDNGTGFDVDKVPMVDERSHIGLTNVKERLKYVCGGELHVNSVIGEGTTVTMVLPKGSVHNETA